MNKLFKSRNNNRLDVICGVSYESSAQDNENWFNSVPEPVHTFPSDSAHASKFPRQLSDNRHIQSPVTNAPHRENCAERPLKSVPCHRSGAMDPQLSIPGYRSLANCLCKGPWHEIPTKRPAGLPRQRLARDRDSTHCMSRRRHVLHPARANEQ